MYGMHFIFLEIDSITFFYALLYYLNLILFECVAKKKNQNVLPLECMSIVLQKEKKKMNEKMTVMIA